jgi:chaperonin GroEL (HSP60 family)
VRPLKRASCAAGGFALLLAIVASQFINDDQKTGMDIVLHALVMPAKQIIDNAGGVGAVVICKQFSKNWLYLTM